MKNIYYKLITKVKPSMQNNPRSEQYEFTQKQPELIPDVLGS